MLRWFVIVIGLLSLAGGIFLILSGHWFFGINPLIFGVLLFFGVLFEPHYRSRIARTTTGLQQTGERFVDPATGKLTEVLYDPKTGERVYRPVT